MKERTKAYVAGLIDAEGCLSISKTVGKEGYTSYDPLIRLTNTYEPLMQWVAATFGGNCKKRESSTGPYYQWRFGSDKHAVRFLRSILCYLVIKHDEGALLDEYYQMSGTIDPEKRENLFLAITKAKNRESVTTNTSRFSSWERNLVNAYFAGFFDGEGTATVIKVKQGKGDGFCYRPVVCLSNTDKAMVETLKNTYGGCSRERPPHRGNLPMYQWDLRRVAEQERFALAMLPYSHVKHGQLKVVLDMARLGGSPNQAGREELFQISRFLHGNKIGSELAGDSESAPVVTQAA